MKVAILSTVGGYGWAGSEEMWKMAALRLIQNGHKVAACAYSGIAGSTELTSFRQLGGSVFVYKPLTWVTRRLASAGLFTRFRRIRGWNPDILCVSGVPCEPFWQRDLLRLVSSIRCPVVFILQANADGMIKGTSQIDALRPVFKRAARIICVSNHNAMPLEHQLACRLRNIVVLPNPIRNRLEEPLPWPSEHNGIMRLATVARYDAECKCQDHTLAALASDKWRERSWTLDLFGSGPDEKYISELIQFYRLQDRVRIRGFERDFTSIWKAHHLHILNSRAEGLALALIESMFCGRPGVVTRAGGNHELLRDGVDGFVSPGLDPEVLRATLERAWARRPEWKDFGLSAFRRVSGWVPADLDSTLMSVMLSAAQREDSGVQDRRDLEPTEVICK